jgi:hypothetical protein
MKKKAKSVNKRYPSHLIKLPRGVMNKHPLLHAIAVLEKRDGMSVRKVAMQVLGCAQQSLDYAVQAARADRDFHLSPERAIALAKAAKIPPYYFNPVLWPNRDWSV